MDLNCWMPWGCFAHGPTWLAVDGRDATRDEVETAFQGLASVALGQPQTTGVVPLDREQAATLVILREC